MTQLPQLRAVSLTAYGLAALLSLAGAGSGGGAGSALPTATTADGQVGAAGLVAPTTGMQPAATRDLSEREWPERPRAFDQSHAFSTGSALRAAAPLAAQAPLDGASPAFSSRFPRTPRTRAPPRAS